MIKPTPACASTPWPRVLTPTVSRRRAPQPDKPPRGRTQPPLWCGEGRGQRDRPEVRAGWRQARSRYRRTPDPSATPPISRAAPTPPTSSNASIRILRTGHDLVAVAYGAPRCAGHGRQRPTQPSRATAHQPLHHSSVPRRHPPGSTISCRDQGSSLTPIAATSDWLPTYPAKPLVQGL